MKKIVKSLLAIGVLLTAIGCSQDQISEKFDSSSEDASAAYFAQKNFSNEFIQTATGDQTLSVDVFRQNNVGDAAMGIYYTTPAESEGIFSIPNEVLFKDGEYKTVLKIAVHDVDQFAKGASYSVKVAVGDHHEFVDPPVSAALLDKTRKAQPAARSISSPKYKEINISTSIALDWQPVYTPLNFANIVKEKPAGTADAEWYVMENGKPKPQATDWIDFWGSETGTTNLAMQRAAGTSVFRILNAGDGGANIIFTVDLDENHKVTVNGTKYFRCVMTEQATKIAFEDSYIFIADWFSNKGISYDTAPCYWDGASQFVFDLYWYVPGLGGFNGPGEGPTDIFALKTGNEQPEPNVAISYLGGKTSETGIKSYSLLFEPNADANYYYATVVKEDLSKLEDAELEAKIDEIAAAIEAGSYQGDCPAVKYTSKSEAPWSLGTADGVFTAIAISYTNDGEVKGVDIKPFIFNPAGDESKIDYSFVAGAGVIDDSDYTDYSQGYFGDNSILVGCEGGGDITVVKYAVLSKADFDAAGLTDASPKAKVIAYLEANGRAFNDAALAGVNGAQNGKNFLFVPAKANSDYKVLAYISTVDATATKIVSVKTEAAMASTPLTCTATPGDAPFGHIEINASFTGTHIVGGSYLVLPVSSNGSSTFAQYFTLAANGTLALKSGITDAQAIALIEELGSAFSMGYENSDLDLMNNDKPTSASQNASPDTQYVVLACADHNGSGATSWTYSVVKSAFSPAVNFTQTVRAEGKNLNFKWISNPAQSVFAIKKVSYALVPKSALVEAGVDMQKLADGQLNDFNARRAAPGADKAAIDAQEQNAGKVLAILKAKGKLVQGDEAKAVNQATGVIKVFKDLAAGEYALVALAYDSNNTKLTIGQATIQ